MKRIIYAWLTVSVLAGSLASFSFAQDSSSPDASNSQGPSLGDIARAARKDKKQASAQRFDNDNLPRTDKLSVVGNASNIAADAPGDTPQVATTSKAAVEMPRMLPGQTEEDRQKVIDQWQHKLTDQHAEVDALTQALERDQREFRVHSAEYYNDPAVRTNQAKWGQDESEYQQKIADEKKAIEEAKQKFGDLEEEARHSGVPNSVSEAVEQPQSSTEQSEPSAEQPSESVPSQSESTPQQSESAPTASESSPN